MSVNTDDRKDKSARLFNKFVSTIKKRVQPDKREKIPAFLHKKYKKADSKYIESKQFQDIILEQLFEIKKGKKTVYKHIHEVVGILNAAHQKNGNIDSNAKEDKKTGEVGEASGEPHVNIKETTTKSQCKKAKRVKRRIKKLELHLKELSNEIRNLSERELTLDDMNNDESDHITEHRLKLRFNRVWEKLCELKDITPSTGRVIDQYLRFEGTRFMEINHKLEKLMNREQFPDFRDVLLVIRRVNKKKDLQLSDKEMTKIAQKSFEVIGNRLQQRREVDLTYNFGSHLTEDFKFGNDPAKSDPELVRKLRENRKLAKSKLEDHVEMFVKKQRNGEDMTDHPESSEDGPSMKKVKGEGSSASDEDSEKEEEEDDEEEEGDVVLDEELEGSESDDDDDEEGTETSSAIHSPQSCEMNTEDYQFLPDQNIFSHLKGDEQNDGLQKDGQVDRPSSSTDNRLEMFLTNLTAASPQEVTSSTSPKHLSEVMDWPKVPPTTATEIIVLSSSDESPENSPIIKTKRINHMVGFVKDIAPPVSSDEDAVIVISD